MVRPRSLCSCSFLRKTSIEEKHIPTSRGKSFMKTRPRNWKTDGVSDSKITPLLKGTEGQTSARRAFPSLHSPRFLPCGDCLTLHRPWLAPAPQLVMALLVSGKEVGEGAGGFCADAGGWRWQDPPRWAAPLGPSWLPRRPCQPLPCRPGRLCRQAPRGTQEEGRVCLWRAWGICQ